MADFLIGMVSSSQENPDEVIVIRDETIDYSCYDMISALHEDGIDNITITYDDGEWEMYFAVVEDEEETTGIDDQVNELIEIVLDGIDSVINQLLKFVRNR